MTSNRILILTDPIGKPAFAPRLRYWCDYLLHKGYAIEVWTEPMESYSFEHNYPIYEIPVYRNRIDWLIKSIWSLITDWRNRHFSKLLRKHLANQSFDTVLCTTFSTFPLRAARDVARAKHIPLLVDIRDLDEQVPHAQYQSHRSWWTKPFRNWYKTVNIRRRNCVLRQADCITTVSPWHVEFLKQFNNNVHLVYNGFDSKQFYFEAVLTNKFLISYIGRIYEFQRAQLIEQAVEDLAIPDMELNWHTPKIAPLPINKVGDEIRKSSLMLVLTSPEAHGMMTTKFYEALGCEKPILCIPSDHGCLADTILRTNAGLASDNLDEIKEFILDKYHEWQVNGFTRQAVKNKDMFNRENQARQIADLLQQLNQHILLTDICWTLYQSNTTFDFLDYIIRDKSYVRLRQYMKIPIVRYLNLLFLKIFHIDILRHQALRYLRAYSDEELNLLAESFVNTELEKRKIEEAWKIIKGRQIVIVSGTILPIARAVAKRIGVQQVIANDIFKQKAHKLSNYDILTDNTSDLPLVQRAHAATVITYGNQDWWKKQKNMPPCIFITNDQQRY